LYVVPSAWSSYAKQVKNASHEKSKPITPTLRCCTYSHFAAGSLTNGKPHQTRTIAKREQWNVGVMGNVFRDFVFVEDF
jgi:hypothetical protein